MTRYIAAAALALLLTGSAAAQARFEVQTIHINPTRLARHVAEDIANCMRDSRCWTGVSIVANVLGVPPQALRISHLARYASQPIGEETRYTIQPPPGMYVCRVVIQTTSVNPLHGDRASLFSLNANYWGVNINTWTPVRGSLRGAVRSWYDGYVTVVFTTHASPQCTIGQTNSVYTCRGDGRNRHGQQACGSASL